MELASVIRLQLNYDLLRQQRDDAVSHMLACSDDDDALHYWCGVYRDIQEDMIMVQQAIAKLF